MHNFFAHLLKHIVEDDSHYEPINGDGCSRMREQMHGSQSNAIEKE